MPPKRSNKTQTDATLWHPSSLLCFSTRKKRQARRVWPKARERRWTDQIKIKLEAADRGCGQLRLCGLWLSPMARWRWWCDRHGLPPERSSNFNATTLGATKVPFGAVEASHGPARNWRMLSHAFHDKHRSAIMVVRMGESCANKD